MSLIAFLKNHGWLPMFFQSDQDAAGDEDVLRLSIENKAAGQAATDVTERNHQANGALREAVRRVRSTTTVFADLERSVRRDHR